MIQLDAALGLGPLFNRKPFFLFPAGEAIYEILRNCYERLDVTIDQFRTPVAPELRIGAPELVLSEYLPDILAKVLRQQPNARFTLRSGTSAELNAGLKAGQFDLVISGDNMVDPAVTSRPLTRLPLVLLAPKSQRTLTIKTLLAMTTPPPLIFPTGSATVCHRFDAALKARNMTWRPTYKVNSMTIVPTFVQSGNAIGLCVDLPCLVKHPGVRRLRADGFPGIDVFALWRRKDPLIEHLLEALCAAAARMRSGDTDAR